MKTDPEALDVGARNLDRRKTVLTVELKDRFDTKPVSERY